MIKYWIEAFRLRTLPLSLACIGMGSFLAASQKMFRWEVFLLSGLTTIFLQILSNLANDYGDSKHGADSDEREGPSRAVQSGKISAKAMKNAMILFATLSLISGLSLIWVSFGNENFIYILIFLILGILAIGAAITYTAGPSPYGYAGLGDISVMIFFGWLGVLGTFYLHTNTWDWLNLLPATSCGLFATAVLNVNNIRDIPSDKIAGKMSIPVRIGRKKARIYHWLLLVSGMVLSLTYVLLNFQSGWQLLFLLALPLLLKNGNAVSKYEKPGDLDPYLKQMALTTLIFVLTFGIGQII
ncbi:1,4-dihydroxy-2-naphthoate polyprenyltransferase [Flexithrix dorotheae]|uniref:1,4-dihydroxy-2-naphthoate polyprenyltransferase n=1 Tax=Flexithrix dorotheae TaxID=70993 RepID=UPI000370D299|nr:1,4-dihydroxy-2-naphthoate polyprenyltransferase [Flexithrix dorotheae]